MANEGVFLGTELKFKIDIEAQGFSMTDNDFTVEIVRGSKRKMFAKSDLVNDGEGNYYVCFDTAEFGAGSIYAIVTAFVPDSDFPDMLRTEVQEVNLLTIKIPKPIIF